MRNAQRRGDSATKQNKRTLVSRPPYVTIPKTWPVLRRTVPRRRTLDASSATGGPPPSVSVATKVWMRALGHSYSSDSAAPARSAAPVQRLSPSAPVGATCRTLRLVSPSMLAVST